MEACHSSRNNDSGCGRSTVVVLGQWLPVLWSEMPEQGPRIRILRQVIWSHDSRHGKCRTRSVKVEEKAAGIRLGVRDLSRLDLYLQAIGCD
jgi:hypothetical protein